MAGSDSGSASRPGRQPSDRLCSTADDGQVIVDPATAGALDDALAVEPLGEKIMKGVAQPAPVFSVTRAPAGGAVRRS